MQPEFWHDRWRMGQTGFHQSAAAHSLQKYWPSLGLSSDSRVFVPLCGKSLDMLWLRDRGHAVTGVELSSIALEAFCAENGIPVTRQTIERFDVYETAQLRLFCGDFFALIPELLGTVAGIYDRASLISWTPHLRSAYADHLTALSTKGTVTLLIVVEYPQDQMSGPPFSVSGGEVERLFAQDHNICQLSRDDVLAQEPRLQARGLSVLHEVAYRLTRM